MSVITVARPAEPAVPARHRTRMAPHLLGLALLLATLAATTPLDSAVTSDEGAYALQVGALRQGGWEYRYAFADADPAGEWFPYVNSARRDDGFVVLDRQPAYSVALQGAVAVAGRSLGLRIYAMAGVLAAAAAAWLLAGTLLGRAEAVAFWLAALSPLLFNGLLAWAHAPVAASAGFAAVAAVRLVDGRRESLNLAVLAAALVAGTLVRREGILFAGALLAVTAVHLVRTGRWRPAARLVPVALLTAAVFSASQAWTAQLAGGAGGVPSGGDLASAGFLRERATGAWHVLAGAGSNSPLGAVVASTALVLSLAAWAKLRRRRPGWATEAAVGAGAATALLLLWTVLDTGDYLTGMLVAWPVAAAPFVIRGGRNGRPGDGLLVAVVALYGAAILATQYGEGGGLEWGGRFLAPLVVPIAALAAVAWVETVRPALAGEPRRVRRAGAVALAALVVVPVLAGAVTAHRGRVVNDRTIAAVEALGAEVVITAHPALPRLAWRTVPGTDWLLVDDGVDLRRAVQTIGPDLPDRVALSGFDALPAIAGWRHETVAAGLAVLVRV